MPLALSQHKLAEDSRPPLSGGTKIGAMEKALLWTLLQEDPACPSRVRLDKVAQTPAPLPVSIRHLNRVRATWQLNRRKGRPRHAACSAAAGGALVRITPHLSCVGVHLFAHWLDQQDAFSPVVARLQQAIEAQARTSSRRLCPGASSRPDAASPFCGPVLCAPVWQRAPHRV